MKRGFILVEAAIASLVLSLALASLLTAYAMTLKANRATQNIVVATELAHELLEEVRLRKWDESTPSPAAWTLTPSAIGVDGSENASQKTTFDDIDDFNGWTESPPSDPLQNALPAAFAGFSRSVSVAYVDAGLSSSASTTDFKKVTVCVTPPKMNAVCLYTVLTNR